MAKNSGIRLGDCAAVGRDLGGIVGDGCDSSRGPWP
jgi:hypothetical protein